jgi:hypothetical protein
VRPFAPLAAVLALVALAACDDAQPGRGGLFGDNSAPPDSGTQPDLDASDDATAPRDARADAPPDARDASNDVAAD